MDRFAGTMNANNLFLANRWLELNDCIVLKYSWQEGGQPKIMVNSCNLEPDSSDDSFNYVTLNNCLIGWKR